MMSSIPASGRKAAAPQLRVLLVDDDFLNTRSLRRALLALRKNLEIEAVHSADEALQALSTQRFDAVITDLHMPGLSGIDWLVRLRTEHPNLLCVVHSSQLEAFGEDEVIRLSHVALAKPARPQELLDALECVWAFRSPTAQAGLCSA
ncbi:MAG: response regulator [Polyangiaceae bacterium]